MANRFGMRLLKENERASLNAKKKDSRTNARELIRRAHFINRIFFLRFVNY